jgi:hypothetical protein
VAAIRIIRSSQESPTAIVADALACDLRKMSQKILDASKRLQSYEDDFDITAQEVEIHLRSVDQALHEINEPMNLHKDIDISRIFELLED